jgi:2-phospho-L-lactate transferase/gluconeogenesis factor (CofD/UPF0052 family)
MGDDYTVEVVQDTSLQIMCEEAEFVRIRELICNEANCFLPMDKVVNIFIQRKLKAQPPKPVLAGQIVLLGCGLVVSVLAMLVVAGIAHVIQLFTQ